jgi:hypothetical protein
MAELIRGLQRLDERTRLEAVSIVRASAVAMRDEVAHMYPRRTGTLQDRVSVGKVSGELRWKVRSRAPHAWLFERGTHERFTKGTGAGRGAMPKGNLFVPAAQRARSRMVEQLIAMVVRQTVPGMDGKPEVRR